MSQYAEPTGPGGPFGNSTGTVNLTLLPHNSAGPEANAVAWSLLATSAVFLGLRLYCKHISRRNLWWDDRLLILAWVWWPQS